MKYFKYHALGNDYIVLNPEDVATALTREKIRVICHRNYGIGSDGILFGPLESQTAQFSVRIFNPDGSEAEKSGNGERGAGYTLASGSSSSAAAAVAHKLGLCDSSITVHMPGGEIAIQVGKDFSILMTGSVTKVADGVISDEIFEAV